MSLPTRCPRHRIPLDHVRELPDGAPVVVICHLCGRAWGQRYEWRPLDATGNAWARRERPGEWEPADPYSPLPHTPKEDT